ncbi:unnamed protein product [Colias eurytheme]|nr:unnamed protein product [Colias eurytheme]
MIQTSSIYWVFLVILAGATCEDGLEEPCRLRHYNGTCIPLTACPFAVAVYNIGDNGMLREMFCGFEKRTPKMCCPTSDRIVFEEDETIAPHVTPKIEITTRSAPEAEYKIDAKKEIIKVTQTPVYPDRTVCGKHEFDFEDRIVGGDFTKIGEFPWIVRIKIKKESDDKEQYACAGSLITDRHVLTAAHCLLNNVVSVRLGEWDQSTDMDCYDGICSNATIDVDIESVKPHPMFNIRNRTHDIGIIKLAKPVNFTETIRPICLPTTPYIARQDYSFDVDYVTAGWGLTEYQSPSAVKRKVTLRGVKFSVCQSVLSSWLNSEAEQQIICAGGEKDKDTCSGDSGGPLMREVREDFSSNWYIFGITSFGLRKCGKEGVPSIYTRVSNYMDWIRQNVT